MNEPNCVGCGVELTPDNWYADNAGICAECMQDSEEAEEARMMATAECECGRQANTCSTWDGQSDKHGDA